MIDVRFLHIGNLVQKNGIHFNVSELYAEGTIKCIIKAKDGTSIIDITGCDGISITEELLFGKFFIAQRSKDIYWNTYQTSNQWFLLQAKEDNPYCKKDEWICGLHERVVKYLHEVQNVYQWETGKILEIK